MIPLEHKNWRTWLNICAMLAIFMLAGGLLYAQPSQRELANVDLIREKMIKAHGGTRQINRVNSVEYSVLETKYGSVPPASSRINYRLDLKAQQITVTTSVEGSTIVKTVNGTDAWQEVDGVRAPLSEKEKELLERVYFLNFLVLLQNENLKFEFTRNCQYKGNTATVVLVSNPMKPSQQVTLFVSDVTGKVLASSWYDENQWNQMLLYTDVLDYMPIGHGLSYPLEYQVYTNGEVTAEGRIVDMKVKNK